MTAVRSPRFRLRAASDGGTLWAGGSFRTAGRRAEARSRPTQSGASEPLRSWKSPGSQATYPVEWNVQTPAGRFKVKALLDDQELDSRGSTGAIYWEGLSDLLDEQGKPVGRGYLEMTGYAAAMRF